MRRSFEECVEGLQQISVRGYGQQLPGLSDEIFTETSKRYIAASSDHRKEMRESIPKDCFLVVIGFSDRFATMADRAKSQDLLRIGYAAHSIEGFRYDERENILRLSLLAHVTRKLDLDPNKFLDWASSLTSVDAQAGFARFKQRPAEINTLETMGIKEVTTPDGIAYEYVL